MYIISDGQTYTGVRVFGSAETVQILGALSGSPGEEIAVYADNGFLLRIIQAGNHTAGEVYNADGAPWECYQSYDNATHPDIAPGGSAWQTFNRPLHGKIRETARYFVQPTGAHDIYKAGEWAVSSGRFWRCLENTAYSPEDYPQAWQAET